MKKNDEGEEKVLRAAGPAWGHWAGLPLRKYGKTISYNNMRQV
jgi:hypothetical protein